MKIFIVEDEYWALEEMKLLLKKYQTEHTLYFYDDGESAFKNISVHEPKLIITDISMPGMDGLELVQKAADIDPAIRCIILTVHETFDYAKKGIQLGVVDYLLKPIKKEVLYEVLDCTIEEIKQAEIEEEDKQLWSINQLIFNQLEKSEKNKADLENQSFFFIYLLCGNWQAPFEGDINIKAYLEEIGLARDSRLLSLDTQRKILLVPYKSEFTPLTKEIYHFIKEKKQVHLCYLVKQEKQNLIEVYQKGHQLMECGKLFGHSSFIEEQKTEWEKDAQSLWTTVRLIEKQMRHGELASISEQISSLVSQIKQLELTQKQLYKFLLDMYYAISYNMQQSTNQLSIHNIDEKFSELDSLVTFDQLKEWLNQLIRLLINKYVQKETAPKHLIPKVKDWIVNSYSNSITFQQFADEHHVSLSYLSQEFKKQTNMTFTEYLANYRIKKAQELFQNGMKSTAEVGILVGYHDPKHFRKVFQKVTGVSPTQYKLSYS
ncbi:YesN/AraC family two-component response regulator [Planomicrobium soli]|uniref:YesN/AraC family two-component response regulator n=1 Tax=Planomicrobium soli TaxID=1176648 RepID=A0A2P8GQN7_9BACL|nr:response regulator [Planomicrobium soli]PSL36264.1 YesN/AraC family two-component response regulator [Planomicrobium soli]